VLVPALMALLVLALTVLQQEAVARLVP